MAASKVVTRLATGPPVSRIKMATTRAPRPRTIMVTQVSGERRRRRSAAGTSGRYPPAGTMAGPVIGSRSLASAPDGPAGLPQR